MMTDINIIHFMHNLIRSHKLGLMGPHPLPIFLHKQLKQTAYTITRLTIWGFFKTTQATCILQVRIYEVCIVEQ